MRELPEAWQVSETSLPDGTPWLTASSGDTRMLHREIFVDAIYADFAADAHAAGRLLVDVGANSGLSAIYFAGHAPGVPVLAVEPAPVSFACLALNLLRHAPTVTPVQTAIGVARGAASLTYYPRTPSQSGLHADPRRDNELTASYLRGIGFDEASVRHATRGLHDGAVAARVPCTRLDDLIDAFYPALDGGIFVKVDVERAELDVLAGLGSYWRAVDGVVCEVEERDGELVQVVRLLEEHGLTTESRQQPALASSSLWIVSATRSRIDRGAET